MTDHRLPRTRHAARRRLGAAAAFAVTFLLALGAPSLEAGWVWTPERGWFNPSRAVPTTPAELMQAAEEAFAHGSYRHAARGFRQLIDDFPSATERPAAYLRLLEAQVLDEEYEDALDTIEEILGGTPDADTIARVLQKKYDIGVAYLTGTPTYFLGIAFSAHSKGVKILDSIVTRFPYQPYADDALYQIGGYYFREGEFDDADVAYKRLLDEYPQSEWVGLTEFQLGESEFRRFKGVEYDLTPLEGAERWYQRYRLRRAGGERATDAERRLREIYEIRAARHVRVARYYAREKEWKSARYHLERVLRDHTDAAVAHEAAELLRDVNRRLAALPPEPKQEPLPAEAPNEK